LFAKRSLSIEKKDWPLITRIIIFHIFSAYVLEFWALQYVTSAKACLLYNLSPFITALFSYFLFAEKVVTRQVYGLIIGFLGFIPILLSQTPLEKAEFHIGFLSWPEMALILSVTSSAYGWMTMKKLLNRGYSFVLINGIGMLGGGILSLCGSLLIDGLPVINNVPLVIPALVKYVGLCGENICMLTLYTIMIIIIANIIGYNLYAHLLSQYSATFLSFAGFVTPLFAAMLGWIFLHESVTWHFFATLLLVLCGLYLFHGKKEIEFEERGL
jgi:drug/metabolite transporter (DMT)-like permease